ncbi:MAG: condensation domain-containing protein, partial [Acidobacteriota bacterium]
SKDSLTLPELRRRLEEERPQLLGVRGIPNRRLWEENETLAWLGRASEGETVGQLRQRLSRLEVRGADPEELWGWGRELPYRVHLSWASAWPDGRLDALFVQDGLAEGAAAQILAQAPAERPWGEYASNPLQERLARRLAPRWRQALEEKLPEYMVPSSVVVLARLPLTPSGKVDRRALPEPQETSEAEGYRAPGRPSEELLAGIWAEVLGLERVGADDNFFDLGGHSLLATQVITRIGRAFGLELPLRALFESPTIAGLASLIEEQRQQGTGRALPPLVRTSREGDLTLSFAQQRLWFLDQLEPGRPLYNMPVFLRLQGDLDFQALQDALSEIMRRHEALRTCFPQQNGVPVQHIRPPAPFPLPIVDLQALFEDSSNAEAQRLAEAEARRPFDLSQGPVIRGMWIQLSGDRGRTENGERRTEEGNGSGFQVPGRRFQNPESESLASEPPSPQPPTPSLPPPSSVLRSPSSVLLLNLHHIVSDGWSMGVFAGEMTVLYGSGRRQEAGGRRQEEGRGGEFAAGSTEKEPETRSPEPGTSSSEALQPHSLTASQPSSPTYSLQPAACSLLPPLPIQYADYAAWQRCWLTGEVVEEQVGYWKDCLKGAAPLDLPSDHPRPSLPSYRGSTLGFGWPAELQQALNRLSRGQDSTLFMTLVAGLSALLHRYSGQTDVSLGSPIANRQRAETEPLIGFFVNTLVMRCDLSGDPPFQKLLARVRETALGAYAHQDIPFEQVVEAADPERSLSRAPLFQVMFGLQNAPEAALKMEGLSVSPMGTGVPSARFDLTISVHESPQGLQGVI